MSARVTRKRARESALEASDTQDPATQGGLEYIQFATESVARTRDKEFWYSDGNIILVARDVEFRVYKGLLADHSLVFRDMFSLPQPHATSSSTAALAEVPCPVVHLSDSPEDLRHVLRVYMPRGGLNAFFHKAPEYTYHTISAAVRLGHKYQMPDLLDNALGFLKAYYPTDCDAWRTIDRGLPGFKVEHAIGVVNLARLTDDASLLLMALLACCNIENAETVVRGFEREDGSREQLALDDVLLCYSVRTRIMDECARITLRVCRPHSSGACTGRTAAHCVRRFKQVLRDLGDSAIPLAYLDPSIRVGAIDDLLAKGDPRLCGHCRKMVEERDARERAAVWKKLPEIFGLALPQPDGEGGQASDASQDGDP